MIKQLLILITVLVTAQNAKADFFTEAKKSVESIKKPVEATLKPLAKPANVIVTTIKKPVEVVLKPLKNIPPVVIIYKGQSIKVGPTESHIKVAGLSASTHNFTERLVEAGCLVVSEGAAGTICETKKVIDLLGKIGSLDNPIPSNSNISKSNQTEVKTTSNLCKTESGICITPDEHPLNADCGCLNDKGELVLGQQTQEDIQLPSNMQKKIQEEGFNFSPNNSPK